MSLHVTSLDRKWLDMAHEYAKMTSGCLKVAVGAIAVRDNCMLAIGANKTVPDLCKTGRGCLRVEKYGDDSKNHRLPEDCRAVHSEIDLICTCAKLGVSLQGATVYVTRYPCEACARALVTAGVSKVIFGRKQPISMETDKIFQSDHVNWMWAMSWDAEDTTR